MSVFSDLTDEELDAEIARLAGLIRGQPTNPTVKSVAGEGRKVEYGNHSSSSDLRRLHREANEEKARRAGVTGTAIGVRFP